MNQIRYTPRPIAVEFFAGAGGLSLGLEQAGFDIVLAVDRDGYHVATHERNFPYGLAICASVTGLNDEKLRGLLGTDREIDLVAGGPPCQGFSHMGTRDVLDSRNTLVNEFVRLVLELRPKAFLMENVPGMQSGATAAIFEHALERWQNEEPGYVITTPVRTLNAADFGVPQSRERLFVLGIRRDIARQAQYPEGPSPEQPARPTVAEAIGDLPRVAEHPEMLERDWTNYDKSQPYSLYARVLRGLEGDPTNYSHPRGWDRSRVTCSAAVRHRPEVVALYAATLPGSMVPGHKLPKLHPLSLAPTLRAGSESEHGSFTAPRPVHPEEPRCITAREAARLHGYPDWFQFYPGKWHAYRQIGNSVCPPVARALGRQLMRALGETPERPTDVLELPCEFALPETRPRQHRRITQLSEWPKILEHLLERARNARGRLVRPDFSVEDVEEAYQATAANMPRNPARRFLADLARSRNVSKLMEPVSRVGLTIVHEHDDVRFEAFANEVVSVLEGKPIVGTSRSWDSARAGRGLGARQGTFVLTTLRIDTDKPRTDASRLKATAWKIRHVYYVAPRLESYRVSWRPHFLGGWGLWDVQVGFPRRCASVPSGWSRSTRRPTPQRGRCCSRWRRSSAARRRRGGSGCGRRSVMPGIGRA